jgi:hypothetical protein
MGKSTTEDNLQAEKHYRQNFFLTKELYDAVLNNFLYDTNLFYNYLSRIDTKNHMPQDSLKSEKNIAHIKIVTALLDRLGWASVSIIFLRPCRGESNNVYRWPELLCSNRLFSLPTNQRAVWTRSPAAKSLI